MRGVILAGGTGSRLLPLTKAINKHLLPVGGKPMIHWPLKVLRDNGITDITIVSSPDGVGQIAKVMRSGDEFDCKFAYRVQDEPGGIAQAIVCAKGYGPIAVILGDNFFLPTPTIEIRHDIVRNTVYVKDVDNPRPFGVCTFRDDRIARVDEKPEKPASHAVATGLYLFTEGVFEIAAEVTPSNRGESEVTTLLNKYASAGVLNHYWYTGFWGDAGTPEGLAACDKACREFV